ncbi:MAG: class I SAM-dependent methyltransferase [Xenococcus sp. MO_188.B8]|nr:class I SAM-dependent methyltransferase [Xenococcus sp. MO_188.B8]
MLSQKDWPEYKKIAQNVEQGGNRDLLINWYDQKYQLFEGGSPAARKCCELLSQNLITSDHLQILDVGCGTGDQARLLQSLGVQEASFYGIDMSKAMLESAKSRKLYKELINSILPDIPYPDCHFDIVISAGTLCSPGNAPVETLSEMIRVTKPIGLLCFSYRLNWFENEESGWKKTHKQLVQKGLIKELVRQIDAYIPSQNIIGLYFVCQKK